MKNRFKTLPALCLLVYAALSPLTSLAQSGPYYTIGELREQTAARWTQTYETRWRTIEVDAPFVLPEADAVPILKVGYPDREPDGGWQEDLGWTKRTELTDVEGWARVACREDAFALYNGWKQAPRSLNGRRINKDPEAKGMWQSGFAPENTYIPMCDISLGEFCKMINAELVRFGYDPADYTVENPISLGTQHWYYYGYKEDALPGSLFLTATQKLCGLPYLSHIQQAVCDHYNGESRMDELVLMPRDLLAGYDGYGEQLSHLYVNNVEVVETLATDVPLCSVEQVVQAIEPLIQQGHIRKVYEIKLGYVSYNEPGVYREKGQQIPLAQHRFYLKPMWQVNCLYVRSATGELRDVSDYTDDERNSLDYYQLLVDAQTGELVEESQAHDRCEFKGFLSWQDIGGN